MKTLTVFYGLDDESQIQLMITSLKTITISNTNILKVLILCSDSILIDKINNLLLHQNLDLDFKFISFEEICEFSLDGKFYWLFSPFLTDSDFIIQLDNDTLINTDLNNMLSTLNEPNKAINAVKIKFNLNSRVVKTVKEKFELVQTQKNISKISINKWINTGVVIINRAKFIDEFKDLKFFEDKLFEYLDEEFYSLQFKPIFSDEAFVILHFYNEIGWLKRKYNLRFQSYRTTKKFIAKGDYIFHYNRPEFINNKYRKFNIVKLINDDNYDFDIYSALSKDKLHIRSKKLHKYKNLINKNLSEDFNSIL